MNVNLGNEEDYTPHLLMDRGTRVNLTSRGARVTIHMFMRLNEEFHSIHVVAQFNVSFTVGMCRTDMSVTRSCAV